MKLGLSSCLTLELITPITLNLKMLVSHARIYCAYHLGSRNANTKETVMKLMVAYRMKASLSSEGLDYVLLWEGKDGLKLVEVVKVLDFRASERVRMSATKPAATTSVPPPEKLSNQLKTNSKCHVRCEHLAKDSPQALSKHQQRKLLTMKTEGTDCCHRN